MVIYLLVFFLIIAHLAPIIGVLRRQVWDFQIKKKCLGRGALRASQGRGFDPAQLHSLDKLIFRLLLTKKFFEVNFFLPQGRAGQGRITETLQHRKKLFFSAQNLSKKFYAKIPSQTFRMEVFS
jgi:hypothetical protein